jgi:serine/threonine protein kinase
MLAMMSVMSCHVMWWCQQVNLKRMQSSLERKRVTMETEILKNLHHPHIINFYDVWKNEEKEQVIHAPTLAGGLVSCTNVAGLIHCV